MSRTTMVIKSSVVLLLLTALFLSNFHVGHAFLNIGRITNKIVCTDRCYKQHPATSSPDFTRCVGDCYGESLKGFAGRSFFFDDSDSSSTRIVKSRSLKKNKKRLSAPKKVNYRRYSTKSDNEEFDEACFTVKCSFMSTCCGGKCYSSIESMGKTCSKGVLCGFSEKSCGGACYNTFSQECSKSGRIVPRGYTGDEEEETAKPSKPAVNPNLFTKFNATIISKQLELVVLAALGFPSASNAQLEKLVDMEIDSTLYNDMRKLSEEFLDGFNRNQDELTIREAFSEFLSSLDMPSDIRETVEQHADMTALKQSLADKQAEYATREENCLANYKGMMAVRYEKDEYKQLFCSYLNALAGSVSAMEGQIYAKRYELQGHWATLLNFLDNGYEASVSNGKDGLWTTSPSIKVFEQNARRAVEPSLVLKLSRSQAMDNAMDSSIVIDYLTMRENVTETRNVTKVVNGTSVTETITEIKVKEYQVVDQSTFYQKSDLVLSNNNQGYYAFPKANVTFAIEFGAMAHSVVTVRPGSDWFSTQVINQYKMGPFKDGYVPSQFFGKNGSLQQYLKSLTLVVDPYVTLTVDKSLKEFIENNKKVTIFNLPFDITPQTGNADIQVSELVDYPNIFSVTLRRRNSNPLVLATELTA